jgi:very-short-patch-repair endonuclease
MDTDARIALLTLAGDQHGLFTTAQALEHRQGPDRLRNWARTGSVRRLRRSVWAVSGAPRTHEQQALAAVLQHGHGAALAERSAAWLWRVPGHLPGEARVLRSRGEHLSTAARSRTSTLVEPADLTVRRGIPVTTPVRTIFDLAGRQQPGRTRRDLNHLMERGLVTISQLDAALDRLATRGRTGITVMRELIAEVHEKGAPAGSNLELVVEDILDQVGFRHMQRQVPIYDHQGFIARVDFGDRRRRLALEVDSDRFHGGLIDRQIDAAKTARLERVGWTVVRVVEREIWWERPALLDRLRKILWSTPPVIESDVA